ISILSWCMKFDHVDTECWNKEVPKYEEDFQKVHKKKRRTRKRMKVVEKDLVAKEQVINDNLTPMKAMDHPTNMNAPLSLAELESKSKHNPGSMTTQLPLTNRFEEL
ncbi:hypothetical protein HAX54_028633, partial [Datura stramonium]|nr:hypothetical protein [Datura stramonium]